MLRLLPPIRQLGTSSFSFQRRFSNQATKTPLWVSTSVGLTSGVLGSLCGVGGGPIILPALRQFSTLTPKQISATGLFCVSISATSGGVSYIEQGFANLPLSGLLIVSSILPTFAGSYMMSKISSKYLLRIIALLMFCAGPAIWSRASKIEGTHKYDLKELSIKNKFHFEDLKKITVSGSYSYVRSNLDFMTVGIASGFMTGLIGMGGGLIMNSYMALFTEMPQHEIIATSLVTMVPIGLAGTIVNLANGYVQFRTGLFMALTATFGMGITSRFARDIDDSALRRIFAFVVSALAIRFLI